jgi:hypothetical protein
MLGWMGEGFVWDGEEEEEDVDVALVEVGIVEVGIGALTQYLYDALVLFPSADNK